MFLWTVISPAPTTRTKPNEPPPPPDSTPVSAAAATRESLVSGPARFWPN